MDHVSDNITNCLRVAQHYFVMTSYLFLNDLSSFVAEYVLLKLSRVKLSTIHITRYCRTIAVMPVMAIAFLLS